MGGRGVAEPFNTHWSTARGRHSRATFTRRTRAKPAPVDARRQAARRLLARARFTGPSTRHIAAAPGRALGRTARRRRVLASTEPSTASLDARPPATRRRQAPGVSTGCTDQPGVPKVAPEARRRGVSGPGMRCKRFGKAQVRPAGAVIVTAPFSARGRPPGGGLPRRAYRAEYRVAQCSLAAARGQPPEEHLPNARSASTKLAGGCPEAPPEEHCRTPGTAFLNARWRPPGGATRGVIYRTPHKPGARMQCAYITPGRWRRSPSARDRRREGDPGYPGVVPCMLAPAPCPGVVPVAVLDEEL